MSIKSFKYLCSDEEVKKFLELPSWKWDCINLEVTYINDVSKVESTNIVTHSVSSHKLFLLERKLIEQGANPQDLEDFAQLNYEERSYDDTSETEDI